MKVVWLTQADRDLFSAFEWLSDKNLPAARRAVSAIYSQIEQLQKFPQLGRVGKITNTRELVTHQTRYIAAYRLDFNNNIIEILALVDESQQWPDEF